MAAKIEGVDFDVGGDGIRISPEDIRACDDRDTLLNWRDQLIVRESIISADLDEFSGDEEWRRRAISARAFIRAGIDLIGAKLKPAGPSSGAQINSMKDEISRAHKTMRDMIRAFERANFCAAFFSVAKARLPAETFRIFVDLAEEDMRMARPDGRNSEPNE